VILGKDLLQNPHYPKVRQDERQIDLPSPGSGKAVERINRDTGSIGCLAIGKRWFQNFAGGKLYCCTVRSHTPCKDILTTFSKVYRLSMSCKLSKLLKYGFGKRPLQG
jgi:hypothetical protein